MPARLGWKNDRPMLPADPHRRWRCLFIDEVDSVAAADPKSAWGTADNYNPSHPFHLIDEVAVAITPDAPNGPLR